MPHSAPVNTSLDYFPCRYGSSKQLFRGPRRRIEGDFAAYLGGTETYGKFIDTPFPALIEIETGLKSVNLGCVNAGVDVYCNDSSLLDICSQSTATVIQIVGAQNMSNRYYRVHPRRNDRFLSASRSLEALYPNVDFTEFTFTGHLLSTLQEMSNEKFLILIEELKEGWIARMRRMLSDIGGKIILLWMSDQAPPMNLKGASVECDPAFVDRGMLHALGDLAQDLVVVTSTELERFHGLDEMYFTPEERPAAEEMLGPLVHKRTAAEVSSLLRRLSRA